MAAAVGVLAGAAAGIALFDALSSKGQSLSITDTITTDMSISSTFTSETQCISAQTGNQSINIATSQSGPAFSKVNGANGSCTLCEGILDQIKTARNNLEIDAVSRNPAYVAQIASGPMTVAMTGGGFTGDDKIYYLGACQLVCSDVVVNNVFQSQVFTSKTDCSVTNVNTNDITQSINGQVNAALKNQEDILGSLEDAFTSNSESISTNLATQMSSVVTTSVSQDLINNSWSSQVFTVGITNGLAQGARSTFVNNVDQKFVANSIAIMKVNNKLNNSLRQSADYSISQTLLNKNDTIGDISTSFLQVIDTMGQLLTTLTGQVLMILGAVLAMVCMIVGALYIFNRGFREAVNTQVDRATTKLKDADFTSGAYNV